VTTSENAPTNRKNRKIPVKIVNKKKRRIRIAKYDIEKYMMHICVYLTNSESTGIKRGYGFMNYLTRQQQNKTAIKPHADSRVRQFKPNDVSGAEMMETVSLPENVR